MANSESEQPANSASSIILPGQTVDSLRAQGKAVEARAEFERLLQEGADSGIDPRALETIFQAVRVGIRNQATAQLSDAVPSSDPSGIQG